MVKTRCPGPDMLLAAEEGVLPEETSVRVREHVDSCAICLQMQRDLRSPALSEPTLAQLARVRRRVFGLSPRRSWYAACAACLLAAAGLGVWMKIGNGPAPSASRATVEAPAPGRAQFRLSLEPAPLRLRLEDALVFRGQPAQVATSYLKQLGDALTPYRAGDYRAASERLGALAARYPRAVEPVFYLGVSRLLLGDTRNALTALKEARKIGGEALDDDIAWYLSVAHERSGAWEASIPLLAGLCKADGPYRQAACSEIGRK